MEPSLFPFTFEIPMSETRHLIYIYSNYTFTSFISQILSISDNIVYDRKIDHVINMNYVRGVENSS